MFFSVLLSTLFSFSGPFAIYLPLHNQIFGGPISFIYFISFFISYCIVFIFFLFFNSNWLRFPLNSEVLRLLAQEKLNRIEPIRPFPHQTIGQGKWLVEYMAMAFYMLRVRAGKMCSAHAWDVLRACYDMYLWVLSKSGRGRGMVPVVPVGCCTHSRWDEVGMIYHGFTPTPP